MQKNLAYIILIITYKNDKLMKKEFQEICNIYKNRYVSIFRQLYPTSKKSGFTERNLSVNFAVAYENYSCQMKQNTVTWYEFQFGKKNN